MREPETDGTITPPKPVDDPCKEPRPNRPPVTSFDPHFGTRSGDNGRDHSDFDEMMWAPAA